MFSPLRNRFGIPGVISVIALVFAMLGGAYAANDSSDGGKATASAKAKKGPRGPKGATGPAGPAGPAGPQGPAGAAGAKGDAGAAGSNGVSVTSTESANAIDGKCTGTGLTGKGGTKFFSASGATYACNGKEGPQGPPGEPWPVGGTLPSEATETGAYYMDAEGGVGGREGAPATSISFPIPLPAALDGFHVVYINGGDTPTELEHCENGEHDGTAGPENPEADPGYLCIYKSWTREMDEALFIAHAGGQSVPGASVSGATLVQEFTGPGAYAEGTWAVTAP